MFTGIIESTAILKNISENGTSKTFELGSELAVELKVDQSLCHNGVCLTVTKIKGDSYEVDVVQETLSRSNLGSLSTGDKLNVERSLKVGDRLDGHFVYGHVDQTGTCTEINDIDGSWKFVFEYDPSKGNVTVEKGSICINGVSLTVVESEEGRFSVAIIPYTYEHTNFKDLKIGSIVNLEFDIVGKYIRSKK